MAFDDQKGEHAAGGNGKTKGRKDGGQEAVLKAKPVKDKINQLVKLFTAAKESSTELSEGIKAVAEEAGVNAKALRSFVAARAGEDFEAKHREVEQLVFLFEKIGE
jgi:flagellar biosynthesis/type III secretory pathway protein FliH